jgi:hypothetical protein
MLKDTADFADSVELMMKETLGVSLEEHVCKNTFIYFYRGIPLWQYHNVGFFIVIELKGVKTIKIPVTYIIKVEHWVKSSWLYGI